MKYVGLIICFIGFVMTAFGQTSKELKSISKMVEIIDSLNWNNVNYDDYKQKIKTLENRCKTFDCGEIPIRLMYYRAAAEIDAGKSKVLYQEVLPTLQNRKIQDPIIKAYGHELAGLHYILNAQNDSCYYHLKIAESLLQKNAPNNQRFGMVNEYLGFYYSFQNIHDTSLIYMNNAVAIHFQNKDTLAAIKAKKYVSSFYNVMGETEKSIKTLLATKRLVNHFPAAKGYLNRIDAGLANAYLSLEDFEKVELIAKNAIDRIKTKNDLKGSATDLWDFYLLLAEVKIKTNRVEAASIDIQKAKQVCENYNLSTLSIINTLFFEAEVQILLGQHKEAEQTLVRLQTDFKSDNLGSYQLKTADLLFKLITKKHEFTSNLLQKFKPQIYAMATQSKMYNEDALKIFRLKTVYDILDKDVSSALSSFNRVLVINDSIQIQKQNTALNELLIREENLEQSKQLAVQEIEIKDKTIQRNALITGFLLILIVIVGLVFRSREKQRLNRLLEQKIEERTIELKSANTQLSQSNKELERFNYIITHDLKEPLRNILGYITLIDYRKMVEDEELQTYFNHITYNGNQMNLLLQNITQYMNITNKSIQISSVDIAFLLNEILQEEAIAINAKNAIVNVNYIPQIDTDKEAIYLVFKNLIDNALTFNNQVQPIINISYEAKTQYHQFLIQDNGIGIESKFHEQIFILFKRLHHRGKYKGAGVGLAMCKQIIEKLGGTISIQNEKIEGTIFKILLPKKPFTTN